MFTLTANVKSVGSFSTTVKSFLTILVGMMMAFAVAVPVAKTSIPDLLTLALYPIAVSIMIALMINRSYFTQTQAIQVSRLIAVWSVAVASAGALFYVFIGI